MDQNSNELEKQKVQQEISPITMMMFSLFILLLSIPIITGYKTYLNKTDGLIYGSIGAVILIFLVYINNMSIYDAYMSLYIKIIQIIFFLISAIIIAGIIFTIRH